MPNKNFVDLDNARADDQKDVMKNIIDADHCPFCTENLRKYHKKPILKESTFWLVTENQWPYTNTKHHFLLIYKDHATTLAEADPAAGTELLQLAEWLVAEYKIPGGGLVMRFGDTEYSAGSVNHLHAQLLCPDIHVPNYSDKPVKVKIGKTNKKSS